MDFILITDRISGFVEICALLMMIVMLMMMMLKEKKDLGGIFDFTAGCGDAEAA